MRRRVDVFVLDKNGKAMRVAVVEQADCGLGHVIHGRLRLLVAVNLVAHVLELNKSQNLAALRVPSSFLLETYR